MKQYELKIPVRKINSHINANLEYSESSKLLAIIIPGTGPVDLDGNMKGMRTNLYKELAQKLHENDVATLRFDKPGVGKSTGDYNRTGLRDLVDTVTQIFDYMKSEEKYKFKKIVLLGHSEGTIIANLVSRNVAVDGLILIGGAGSNIESVMKAQNNRLADEMSQLKGIVGKIVNKIYTREKMIFKQIFLFQKVQQSSEDSLKIGGQTIQAKWLREHLDVREEYIVELLDTISVPTLIINGDKDVQIDLSGLEKLKKLSNHNLNIKTITGMNHILKTQTEEASMLKLKKIYKALEKNNISESLLISIKIWILKLLLTEECND